MTRKEIIIIVRKLNFLLSTYNYYLTEDRTQEAYRVYDEAINLRALARELGFEIEIRKVDVETESTLYDYVAYTQVIFKNGDVMINWVCGCNWAVDNATAHAMKVAVNAWLAYDDVKVFWTDADNKVIYYEKFH